MATERRIKIMEQSDGKACLHIIERNDGRYRFESEAEQEDGDGFAPYWLLCDISGLYAAMDETEAAAHRDVLWLIDQISN